MKSHDEVSELTAEILGLRAVGGAHTGDYITWACGMLLHGYDTRDLRILAGLHRMTGLFEVEDRFSRALSQLGLSEPTKDDAVIEYGLLLARRILRSEITPVDGARLISRLCMEADYDTRLIEWFILDERIDLALYSGISDFVVEDIDETVISEARGFLSAEGVQ